MRLASGRPWWQRALALCLAVWFVAVATDLPGVHACAMHGLHGGTAVRDGAHHDAGAHRGMQHPAAAATAAHHGAAHHTPASDGGAGGGACTCLGHCCGAASVVPPAVALVRASDAQAPTPPTPGRPQHEYVAAWVDFVLPFSTAPPSRVTA